MCETLSNSYNSKLQNRTITTYDDDDISSSASHTSVVEVSPVFTCHFVVCGELSHDYGYQEKVQKVSCHRSYNKTRPTKKYKTKFRSLRSLRFASLGSLRSAQKMSKFCFKEGDRNGFPVFPYLTTYTSEPKYNPYTNNIDRQVIGYHDEYESIDMKKFKRWNVRNMVNYVDNEESSVANGFGHQSRDKKDTTTATPVSLPVVTLSTNKLVPSPLYKSLAFQFLGSAKFKLRSDDVFSTPVLNFGDANANEQFYGNITDREELEMFLNEVSERSSARLDEDSSDLNVSAKQPK